eukprot:s2079_g5.t1
MDDIRADEPAWQCPVCNNKLHDTEDRGRVSMGIPWAVVLMMQGLSGTRGSDSPVQLADRRLSPRLRKYLHPSAADVGIPVRFQKRQAAFSGLVRVSAMSHGSSSAPKEDDDRNFSDGLPVQYGQERPERPLGRAVRVPSTEGIIAWFSSRIFFKEELLLVEPGRLFYWGVLDGADRLQKMLLPVFSHIHRDDHCERFCLLHQTRAIARRCGFDGFDDCSGYVRMYVSHFPCISCIAVICQFVRLFPAVRFELDYDNLWKTRFQSGRRNAKPDAWKIFDVLEGTVDAGQSASSASEYDS